MSPIEHLVDAFPQDFRFVYRHFPLISIHDKAHITARAAEAAGRQGRFFEYLHVLYERAAEWGSAPDDAALRDSLVGYAAELELDTDQFATDLDAPEIIAKIDAAYEEAVALGLPGTPTIFVNGQAFDPRYLGATIEQWAGFIETQKALRDLPQYDEPPMSIDPDKTYLATVETEKGSFVIELLPKVAPRTVNSFVFLAGEGWFDGVTFHRVIEGFVAQTGDPTGTGAGGPGYAFPNEIDPDLKHDGPGVVAMANSGADTNGSQWYITLDAQPDLDGNYTIFGKVIEGMDVVRSLTLRDPETGPDYEGDRIISITIQIK